MIDMQMRAHNIIDAVHGEAGSREAPFEAVAVHHVPERPRRSWLVISDTGIDENVVARRLYEEALNAEHQAADRIDESWLQPGAVLLERLVFPRWRTTFEAIRPVTGLIILILTGAILFTPARMPGT